MLGCHRFLSYTLLGLLFTLLGLSGCSHADPWEGKNDKLRVVASFPPLHCFTLNVAGEDAAVLPMLENVGVHEYQPSPKDASKLQRANLFLINGLDLDNGFAQKLTANSGNPGLKLHEIGKCIPQKQLRKYDPDRPHEHAPGQHCVHGEYDPHIWLGIPEAILMVECIRDKLKEADPQHAQGYDERAKAYVAKLQAIQQYGLEQLKGKQERKLITFHDSQSYFARAFGLEVLESVQPLAGEDPSPARLAQLVKLCQEKKVRHIAVEPNQMSNSAAKVLVAELKAKGLADAEIVELDVLESAAGDQLTPDYYEKRLRGNIDRLAKALK